MALVLSGCTLLPKEGPANNSVRSEAAAEISPGEGQAEVPYLLVDLAPDVMEHLVGKEVGFSQRFAGTTSRTPSVRLGKGDVIEVAIYEAAAGGLFTPAEGNSIKTGNYVQIPQQTIDEQGNITVPYAGQVPAAGRTTAEVQATIVQRLQNRAIEPQAVVTVREQHAAQVSVLGTVNSAAKFNASPAGERVLDAIARAGGIKSPGYQTYVTLQRGSRKATLPFNALVTTPSNNIFVQPGDVIYVSEEIRAYIAVGAVKTPGQVNFEAENIDLMTAVGKAGGLLDDRADGASVFVFRYEDRRTVEKFGRDVSRFSGPRVPVVYALNLRSPSGYFLGNRFQMRNGDVLYVGNADAVELSKAINLVRSGTQIYRDIRSSVTNY